MIYLDNPATSRQKPFPVIASLFSNTLKNSINAGRGSHRYSLRGAALLEEAAEELSLLFGISDTSRIAFTQNATYALNMAIGGVLAGGGHAIVTSMEHNSVLRPVHARGAYTMVWADSEGYVSPADIEAVIGEDTRLIVCTHMSNVCGSIQPIAQIGEIARQHNVLFLVDAAQSAGSLDIDIGDMNIDLLAFSGHKGLMGPMGTGGLYVGERAELTPIITGGTGSNSDSLTQPDILPDMLEAGTQNVPAIAALGRAAAFVREIGTGRILAHERALAEEFIGLVSGLNGVKILGGKDMKKRNGTVAFTIEGIASAEASERLDRDYKIAVRGGWHCAYTAHKTLGTSEHGAVRAGFGFYNSRNDVKKLADAVKELANS